MQIPSQIYDNVYDFLNDENLKPAFFKNYDFIISDDPIDNRTCFNSAKMLGSSLFIASAFFLAALN